MDKKGQLMAPRNLHRELEKAKEANDPWIIISALISEVTSLRGELKKERGK